MAFGVEPESSTLETLGQKADRSDVNHLSALSTPRAVSSWVRRPNLHVIDLDHRLRTGPAASGRRLVQAGCAAGRVHQSSDPGLPLHDVAEDAGGPEVQRQSVALPLVGDREQV